MTEEFPAQGYKDNVLEDCFADATRYLLDHYVAVDRAHAVMLAEQEIISTDVAQKLLNAIGQLNLDEIRAAEYDGSVEDLFYYLQREITEACGDPDIAGRLHTARSRNDIDVTIYRLQLREQALELFDACDALRRVFPGPGRASRRLIDAGLHAYATRPAHDACTLSPGNGGKHHT